MSGKLYLIPKSKKISPESQLYKNWKVNNISQIKGEISSKSQAFNDGQVIFTSQIIQNIYLMNLKCTSSVG